MAQSRSPITLDTAALFRRVLELRMSFLAVLNEAGIVVEINNAPARHGLSRDQFVGRHIAETPSFASDPEWRRTWNSRLSEVAASGQAVSYEDVFTLPDGAVRSANATLTPVHGEHAGPLDPPQHFLLEADDTTEQLQVELALRASERHFHDMTESLPVMCWTCDAEGVTDYVNARWTDYTGCSAEQLKGWGWTDTIHPDDRAGLAGVVGPSLAAGASFTTEYRVLGVDGVHRWFEMRMEPVRDVEGQLVRWYGAAIDVHEAHELRRAHAPAHSPVGPALEASGVFPFHCDLIAQTVDCPPGLAELWGVEPAALSVEGLADFGGRLHPDDVAAWASTMGRAYAGEDPHFVVRYRMAFAPERTIEARGAVAFDDDGKPLSLSGVAFVALV